MRFFLRCAGFLLPRTKEPRFAYLAYAYWSEQRTIMSAVFSVTRGKRAILLAAGAVVLSIFIFTGNAHAAPDKPGRLTVVSHRWHYGGYYGYRSMERLWVAAGGSWYTASHAACIAAHESGGRANAISPTSDYGLWQIHDGGYAMLDPYANARRAVRMSSGGRDWSAWTTSGMC